VGLLSFAKGTEAATQFMDFLASPQAREFYKEYGWVIKEN
jgi:ABC-type molybdate transport system substrate-binding protein